ncbi:chromosome segregation ATPase [Bartonella fuyuanensis]|uniref:Chromosome segregation ATPase n=1 Tax=Bartonella fuyuanensis TaxID=1460968 RepID=A0A840DUS2_9HYPH|nr:type IV secretion system protein VirB5 [Bartonella fuyuanensis]MBB4076864.1 chromosome segregation ATPase [Bartonella fuyuanensis]
MKKYGLVTVLSFSFISHAISQTIPNADEYYKQALESTQKLDAAKSETAENIYQSAIETANKIKEISHQLESIQSKTDTKPEELQALQVKLSLLQANLQVSSLKLQSLDMIQARDTKTKDELREEEEQQKHKYLEAQLKEKEKQLKEKLESTNANVRL